MQKIILASKSPRRKQLLEWAEIDFEIITNDTDESFPSELALEKVPIYIANSKAEAVAQMHQNRIVLAADTIVTINNKVIGKPNDKQEAVHTLHILSGKTHKVITGVSIIYNNQKIAFSNTTEVQFHTLTHQQIEYYIEHFKPYDKAGAYAIQEWIGVIGIQSINGDFYNVMGLPISLVVQKLEEMQEMAHFH